MLAGWDEFFSRMAQFRLGFCQHAVSSGCGFMLERLQDALGDVESCVRLRFWIRVSAFPAFLSGVGDRSLIRSRI